MPLRSAAAAPATDLLYARSAGLVVLAGVLWSMGGVSREAGRGGGLDPDRPLPLAVRRPGRGRVHRLPRRRSGPQYPGPGLERASSARCASPRAFVTFVTALTLTTVANAAFVLATTPFAAALLGRLILGEPVRSLDLAGHGLGRRRGRGHRLARPRTRAGSRARCWHSAPASPSPCSASPCAAADRWTARRRC